ncbi:hypothetical protein RB195_006268 [Necator americanus]|uniref:Reverse transcriptase domain-containing protein n=1 Tax=Necator americanus TaxID=51031 RepID=A0ABR1BVK8_NECAM
MELGTAPGPDFISANFLRVGSHPLHAIFGAHDVLPSGEKDLRPVEDLANRSYPYGEDLRNYRPIYLLSVLYKVFTKIILTRISRTLNEVQPQEQTGFRRGLSCLDHIQTVSRVVGVCWEYRLSLVLAFVDYEEETNPVRSALFDQGVDASYVRTLANCYSMQH